MALLAESLVEEWLNRKGFFTIRGLKQDVDEIDLLAVAHRGSAVFEAWHVESQVSFRPVSYITPLSQDLAKELGKKKSSAFERTPQQLAECVNAWVEKKFRAKKKVAVRAALWPGATWRFVLAHGVAKHPKELELVETQGVALVSLRTVLNELCAGLKPPFTAARPGYLDGYRQRYAVDCPVDWRGKRAIIRSGWIVEHGSEVPRFTSCYVL